MIKRKNMENLSIRYVFDRKHVATESKTGLLQIEVRQNKTSKKVFISTGIRLYKSQFSDKNGFSCKNHPNARLITAKGRKVFDRIEAFCLSDKCNSISDVKFWNRVEGSDILVLDFMRSELMKKNVVLGVVKYHTTLINQLEAYGKIRTFSDLTYNNIAGFDEFLRKTIKAQSTMHKRHVTFNCYIKEAFNRGMCESNPYLLFKIPKGKSKEPTYLLESEVKKILDLETSEKKLERVRDLFIFQSFTGLSYIDMQNFSKEWIDVMDGYKVIRSSRAKTDESFISIFLPEAVAVAEKYDYNLPRISNEKYNDYLKLLAVLAGINKRLTSHVARHTFGTYLLNKNIPIETVSRAMGHANIRQTQHYARMLGRKVVDDMSKLL